MEVDVPSQQEFDNLKDRMEAVARALLNHFGLEEKRCDHPGLEYADRWSLYKCEKCKGTCIVFERASK